MCLSSFRSPRIPSPRPTRFSSSTIPRPSPSRIFFFNNTATTEIYPLSLPAALPISCSIRARKRAGLRFDRGRNGSPTRSRSEEHTSELQSLRHLVCRLLLEKKKARDLHTRKKGTADIAQRTAPALCSVGEKSPVDVY